MPVARHSVSAAAPAGSAPRSATAACLGLLAGRQARKGLPPTDRSEPRTARILRDPSRWSESTTRPGWTDPSEAARATAASLSPRQVLGRQERPVLARFCLEAAARVQC